MSLKYVWERSEKGLDLGMGGSGLDHSVMLQRMNLQTPQTQYGQGGAEDDAVDEALPKDNPKLRKERDKRVRADIREMRRLIGKQRRWLRDLLLIESENLPKRSMIDFEKKRRWCGWCRKERNDTSFETYIKTRIEGLRILCRDHETNESGAGSGGGDDKGMSKRSKKNRGEKLGSGKEDNSHHDLLPDSNLLRIAMLEMYKVLANRSGLDCGDGGSSGGKSTSLAGTIWPESGTNDLSSRNEKNSEKDIDSIDIVMESKEFSGREGFRDRYTGE